MRLFAQFVAHKRLLSSQDVVAVFPEERMNEYVLAMCEKEQFQYAARFLVLASELGLQVNGTVYEAIICRYCELGMLKGPLILIQEMHSMGLHPSQTAMNALVQTFNKAALSK